MNSNFLTMYATLNVVLWTIYLTFFIKNFAKNMLKYTCILKKVKKNRKK